MTYGKSVSASMYLSGTGKNENRLDESAKTSNCVKPRLGLTTSMHQILVLEHNSEKNAAHKSLLSRFFETSLILLCPEFADFGRF